MTNRELREWAETHLAIGEEYLDPANGAFRRLAEAVLRLLDRVEEPREEAALAVKFDGSTGLSSTVAGRKPQGSGV